MERQTIRSIGANQALIELRRIFPVMNRRELRKMASKLNKEAWKNRDKEVIAKMKGGTE